MARTIAKDGGAVYNVSTPAYAGRRSGRLTGGVCTVMKRIKAFVETQSSLVMVAGAVLGLLFPFGAYIPPQVIICVLASLIFFACFKMDMPLSATLRWKNGLFYVLRFVAFPLILWRLAGWVVPDYATGLLLQALCPVAAAGAALASIYGGSVTFTFAITVLSSFLCIFVIPAIMHLTGNAHVVIPVGHMMETLACCILLPSVIFYGVRKKPGIVRFSGNYGRMLSVLLCTTNIFIILARLRSFFLAHPADILLPFALNIVFYAIAIFMVWPLKARRVMRVGYMTASGMNNVALGVGLAMLYFDQKTILLLVCGEFAWSLMQPVAALAARHMPDNLPQSATAPDAGPRGVEHGRAG